MLVAALEGAISGYRSLYPHYVFGRHEVWPSANDARLAAVSSHNIRHFPPTVGGRRVTSAFHVVPRPARRRSRGCVTCSRNARRSAFRRGSPIRHTRSTKWLLDGSFGEPFENAQTNHIALHAWCDASHGRLIPDRYDSWSGADRAAYGRERLEFAKSLLEDFIMVGTVERLPESLGLLRTRSARFGINLLPVDRLTRANASDLPPGDDASWIDTDPLGARLLESVAIDGELHAYAQRRLEEPILPERS